MAVEYRRLEKGEAIQWGDEIDNCGDGWRDQPKWEPVHCSSVGKPAPDPQYPSHRQYRRSSVSIRWEYDEETSWRGASQFHDQGDRFWYEIRILPTGMFDVGETDRELICSDEAEMFLTFAGAAAYCQAREDAAHECV